MFLKSFSYCQRSLYRQVGVSRNINHTARDYSQNIKKEDNAQCKFAGYKVTYSFRLVRYAALLNLSKKNLTLFSGIGFPVLQCLYMFDVVSQEANFSALSCGSMFLIWMHSIGYFCNNVIGFAYFNKDNQTVILSYVNYWGRRIDQEIDIKDIVPLTETRSNIFQSFYRMLHITVPKQKLKLYVKDVKIYQENDFMHIFGNYK